MYLDLARELKKNTDIMEVTFKKFNLRVLQYSYHPCSDNDADCELIIELTTIDGDSMNEDAKIKVNLYDENGDIFYNTEEYINSDEFAGYDTFNIPLYNNKRSLLEAKTARVYISQG